MTESRLGDTGIFQSLNWWIGQIADDSTWRDNQDPGKLKNPHSIPGWGYRYKVRVWGHHPQGSGDNAPVPEDKLPWATLMFPVTAGGGQGSSLVTPNIRQGNIVYGMWLDGSDCQVPVIMGVLANNAQTALKTCIGKGCQEAAGSVQQRFSQHAGGGMGVSGYAKQQNEKPQNLKPKVPDQFLKIERAIPQELEEAAAILAKSDKDYEKMFNLNSSNEEMSDSALALLSSLGSASDYVDDHGITRTLPPGLGGLPTLGGGGGGTNSLTEQAKTKTIATYIGDGLQELIGRTPDRLTRDEQYT